VAQRPLRSIPLGAGFEERELRSLEAMRKQVIIGYARN